MVLHITKPKHMEKSKSNFTKPKMDQITESRKMTIKYKRIYT